MKKKESRKLRFSKIAIARINKITQRRIQGGFTDTISELDDNTNLIEPPLYGMSENPDANNVCYAER